MIIQVPNYEFSSYKENWLSFEQHFQSEMGNIHLSTQIFKSLFFLFQYPITGPILASNTDIQLPMQSGWYKNLGFSTSRNKYKNDARGRGKNKLFKWSM